jgi:hypothetical protein
MCASAHADGRLSKLGPCWRGVHVVHVCCYTDPSQLSARCLFPTGSLEGRVDRLFLVAIVASVIGLAAFWAAVATVLFW